MPSHRPRMPAMEVDTRARLSNDQRLRRLRIAYLAVCVVVALVLVFVITRPLGAPQPAPAFVLGSGEEQLKRDAAVTGPSTGQRAPGFGGEDLGLTGLDAPLALEEYRGRAVWVVFWATYCEPCKEEEPDLVAMFDAHEADGLVIVAIDVGEPIDEVRDYAVSRRLPYPIAIDVDGKAQAAYGAIGTPTHYFVDPDGVIRDRAFGRLTRSEMERRVALIHASDHALGASAER